MSQTIYTALGLMSGTSLDGVDAAFLETDGEKIFGFGPGAMQAYSVTDRDTLMQATQAALRWQFCGSRPNSFAAAEDIIHQAHCSGVDNISSVNANWMSKLDIIGFHGQTVLHHPPVGGQAGQTLQLGDGQVLADKYGVPCAFDFRSADVAAGGQGAPLAPIYHKALVEYSELSGVTAVLNLGGVGNVTLVGPDLLMAADTGPANGPLDNWMEKHDLTSDKNGRVSREGHVDFDLVEEWLSRAFFQRALPRSADRYDFDVIDEMKGLSLLDGAATLCAYAVLSAKRTLTQMGARPDRIIVCGGGRHNKTIMTMLSTELGCPVLTAETVGWDADMIEAQAFAYLAVRSTLGQPISFPETTGVPEPLTGGRIAYPNLP